MDKNAGAYIRPCLWILQKWWPPCGLYLLFEIKIFLTALHILSLLGEPSVRMFRLDLLIVCVLLMFELPYDNFRNYLPRGSGLKCQ